MTLTGRELRSHIGEDGVLTLSLQRVEVTPPAPDEVVIRVEAAPINPSDLGLMIGPGDMSTLRRFSDGDPRTTLTVSSALLAKFRGRVGRALPVGLEGAGTVVAAGKAVKHLEGRKVAALGSGLYADFKKIAAKEVSVLPEGASPKDGAAIFVNPLTALGFIETMRLEGHQAIVHTAAASNLGQMLQKICVTEGIPLVNIVRSDAQENILREIGAQYVLNSESPSFDDELATAISQTGATLAFDAIGGGSLGSKILQAMEQVAVSNMPEFSQYGSEVYKQLYIYGMLDRSPVKLTRTGFGGAWSAGGWLLLPFLRKAGPDVNQRLRQRVIDELTTTFASKFTRTIGLAEAIHLESLRAAQERATGQKLLIDPTIG